MISIFLRLIKIINSKDDNLIFIYSPHLPYIFASILCKLFYSKLKICLYINDLPEYMSANKNILYLAAKKVEKILFRFSLKFVDLFLVVTEQMPKKLCIENKPFHCLEGVYVEEDYSNRINFESKNNKNKIILYTGTLDKRYGIENLLNAFTLLTEKEYELWICGFGDMESEILKYVRLDTRIKFLGQKTHIEVLEFQKKCDILVNPRLPIGDYTMFSFPIKTLEYLASSKPCIMYKLDGIPKKYHAFFYTPDNFTAESLASKINEVLKMDKSTLLLNGLKSRNFILDEIGPKKKFKEVYDFFQKNL